jgi:hypothetical protein
MENFNNFKKLDKDIEKIGNKVNEVKERLNINIEKKQENFSDNEKREVVKQSVKEVINEGTSLGLTVDQPSNSNDDEYLADYLTDKNVDDKVKDIIESLLQLAVDKGVFIALNKSKKFSPFIQDAFHDSLVDKLLPTLKEKNII